MKTMLRCLGVVLLAGCAKGKETPIAVQVPPVVAPPLAARDAVLALLNAHEVEHGDRETWKRLGPAGRAALLDLLADPAHRGDSLQVRAAESLGFVATPEDVSLLKTMAGDPRAPRTTRMGAIGGLWIALGPDAVPVLAPHLASDEVGVRSRTVDVLAATGTPEARAALIAAAGSGDEALKRRIARVLK